MSMTMTLREIKIPVKSI